MSKKKLTLNNSKEILNFFNTNYDKLSYIDMNDIIAGFLNNKIRPIVFVSVNKDDPQDLEKPKKQIIEWLEENLKAIDEDEYPPIPFLSTFPDRN